MSDLAHYFGGDLILSPTGDLQVVDAPELTRQRILRRLLTAPGGYIWHLTYGAGIGAMIGQPTDARRIQAIVGTQVLQEAAVARSPVPTVTVSADRTGVVVAHVTYGDAGQIQSLELPLSAPSSGGSSEDTQQSGWGNNFGNAWGG